MQIIEIKDTKKHLTALTLLGGEVLELDKDTVLENGLCKGTVLDEEQIKEYKHDSDYRRAKSRALWYLDRMDYTEKALFEKLVKAGFSKKIAAEVLAKLCEFDLIDDRRYAERLAERCMENNISKREAMQKMLLKGIPYELIKEVLAETEADEVTQIATLLRGKYANKLSQVGGVEKVYAALARKGFSFGNIRAALKEYSEELEFCEED